MFRVNEPQQKLPIRCRNGIVLLVIASWLIIPAALLADAGPAGSAGPTAESALAAEKQLNQALLMNDAEAVGRLLDSDWAVINTHGGLGDGIRTAFLAAIKEGKFTREKMVLTEPRVRLYGNMALVTTHLATAGTFNGKHFDVQERQTDVLVWRQSGWKSVLHHETEIRE